MNREQYLMNQFPTKDGMTYIQSLDMFNGKPKAMNHDDTIDRKVGKEFLEERGWYGIEFGGKYDLDLMVPQFQRGCDVEMNNYNHYERFRLERNFRIPARKQKYWLDSGSRYDDWKVDYIQFSNNNTDELLWYSWKTIEPYVNNTIIIDALKKCGYTDTQATFIAIPFDIGKDTIQHWKLIGGVWTKLPH